MKKNVLLMFVFATSLVTVASAQKATEHPAYLHALSNLRAARWMIQNKSSDWKATQDETFAIQRIDAAITNIKSAAIDDGKDINDQPPADNIKGHKESLSKAIEWLKKARTEIAKDDDNTYAKGLRKMALKDIDDAIELTEKAKKAAK